MTKKSTKLLGIIGLSLLASACTSAEKKTVLECSVKGGEGPVVTIALDDRTAFEKSLSCIQADFLSGMTPCAPNGGFGLSGAAGKVDLSAITDTADGYVSHEGSVTSYSITAEEIQFSGGKNSAGAGYKEDWKFLANRNSGAAVLTRGSESTDYACRGK